jgi:predicted RNA binding protein YcfA (HicA-like mRNA interferase family)
MARLPVLKPREVAAALEKLGFAEVRQRGSHRQYRHPDGRGTTVPFHGSRDISPFLLRQIIKDIRLTPEESCAIGLRRIQALARFHQGGRNQR